MQKALLTCTVTLTFMLIIPIICHADCSDAYSYADDAYIYAKKAYNSDSLDDAQHYARRTMNAADDAMSAADDCGI